MRCSDAVMREMRWTWTMEQWTGWWQCDSSNAEMVMDQMEAAMELIYRIEMQ